jgi:NAD(P)-dependent dehydrogenase (short-subunit alcohol dehydrogenase family)
MTMTGNTGNKVAMVTAASRGMGAAIARRLSRDGFRVALMSRSEEILGFAEELGGVGFSGSVTDPADLEGLVDLTIQRFGRIDALVCNTGHPPKGDLLSISDEDWHEGFDLVLLNVVRLARLVTPWMERQGGGVIVNISTFGAVEPSLAFPVSSALRAGLGAFVKLYADRYAPMGIRMNNVLPGFIDSYEVGEENRARIPLGRPGLTEEVAGTVAFLLSDDAGYVTGQSIRVDGGITRSM